MLAERLSYDIGRVKDEERVVNNLWKEPVCFRLLGWFMMFTFFKRVKVSDELVFFLPSFPCPG